MMLRYGGATNPSHEKIDIKGDGRRPSIQAAIDLAAALILPEWSV
jgi:hypothetical protein